MWQVSSLEEARSSGNASSDGEPQPTEIDERDLLFDQESFGQNPDLHQVSDHQYH